MNPAKPLLAPSKVLFGLAMRCRRLLPLQISRTFGPSRAPREPKIERVYVINLDRQPGRWAEIEQELRHVLDSSGVDLLSLTERYAAIDAKQFEQEPFRDAEIDPIYTLADQLFVEPQPLALPNRLELNSPIRMSRPEVAVARSHINVWRQIAASKHEYVLVLEDDVWFRSRFASLLDQAWSEIKPKGNNKSKFDILYLSYEEVKHGAPKTFLSDSVFSPVRGLWHLSGYVISREGAEKLLRLLPCRGPVDLWINHQFRVLNVFATRVSIISQRRDLSSTNSYSILPALTKIGVISSEGASLFQARPVEGPVFAFGSRGSGLTSLAMALSMLGYRCCSDLEELPGPEQEMLLSGSNARVFNAYVNIGSLKAKVRVLRERYPRAKFIFTPANSEIADDSDFNLLDHLNGADAAVLELETLNKWQVLCEHLRCPPPACPFPELADLGQRQLISEAMGAVPVRCKTPKRDKSPWIVEPRQWWQGIHSVPIEGGGSIPTTPVSVTDYLEGLNTELWLLRDDTFTGNLALFRPSNVEFRCGGGAVLNIKREPLGVRELSAASLTSRHQYLYGRFEATMKASKVPGVVTGFFLHRDSPRQEIDIEITGNRTDRLLVNVFYNPGEDGVKYDYGYRGAPSYIDLGFDASESFHRFAIEWEPHEIRWLVDNRVVHRRFDWDPTPIPHLAMALHVNAWPSGSEELAGRLASRQLPSTSIIKSIVFEANLHRRSLSL